MKFRRPLRGDRSTHTWEYERERRAQNGGLGCCNTGSGKRMICALGGIGCDVDHVTIAQMAIDAAPTPPAAQVAISAEDLHDAADIVGAMGDDESKIGEYGLPWDELQQFVDTSDWRDLDPSGPLRLMDPLALAIGISIGIVAAAHPQRPKAPPS